jgi:multiple sugar transport system ATP-binding protein
VIAHFPLAARSAAGSASLVAALGTESPLIDAVAEGGTVLTARLGPRTKARSGEPLRISVDVERLHFFDPQSEEAIS